MSFIISVKPVITASTTIITATPSMTPIIEISVITDTALRRGFRYRKAIKSSAHAIKTGMSIAQVMYKNPLAENAKQTADYVDLASKMSPEYRRRYMYD